MALSEGFLGILGVPTSAGGGLMMEILLLTIPIWAGFLVGLVAGWAWRPSWWPSFNRNKFDSLISKLVDFSVSSSPSIGFPSIQRLAALNIKFSSCCAAVGQIRANGKDSYFYQPANGEASCR